MFAFICSFNARKYAVEYLRGLRKFTYYKRSFMKNDNTKDEHFFLSLNYVYIKRVYINRCL